MWPQNEKPKTKKNLPQVRRAKAQARNLSECRKTFGFCEKRKTNQKKKSLGSVHGVVEGAWLVRLVNARAGAAAIAEGRSPRGGRGDREKVRLPTEQRARLAPAQRPAVRLPTPSLRFASRVQRESKCKRPKQTFKASWVGLGAGMDKRREGSAGTPKPSHGGGQSQTPARSCSPKT